MITTVTTTTTTIVSTVAVASLALIAILTLMSLLIQKEVIGGLTGMRARQWGRVLNIAIVPLLFVFLATVFVRVVDVLR